MSIRFFPVPRRWVQYTVRASGAILQIYYNSAVGKAQWIPFPHYQGVLIMPNNLLLPVKAWIKGGLPIGAFVRVVLITGE